MHDQFAKISTPKEDSAVSLFDDAGRAAESDPETKAFAVIRTVANLSVARFFWTSGFQSAIEIVAQKWLDEIDVGNDVVTSTIDLLSSTVSVTKIVLNKVEKRFLEMA